MELIFVYIVSYDRLLDQKNTKNTIFFHFNSNDACVNRVDSKKKNNIRKHIYNNLNRYSCLFQLPRIHPPKVSYE